MSEVKVTQVHGTTPQELKDSIITDVKAEIQKLSESLKNPNEIKYLTRQEVATIFQISLVTLTEWNKKGILNPYRLGKLVRYKSNEIDQALTNINLKKQA